MRNMTEKQRGFLAYVRENPGMAFGTAMKASGYNTTAGWSKMLRWAEKQTCLRLERELGKTGKTIRIRVWFVE